MFRIVILDYWGKLTVKANVVLGTHVAVLLMPHHPQPTRPPWNYSMAHQKEISVALCRKINDKIIKDIQWLSHSSLWKEPKEKKADAGDYPALFKRRDLLHIDRSIFYHLFVGVMQDAKHLVALRSGSARTSICFLIKEADRKYRR